MNTTMNQISHLNNATFINSPSSDMEECKSERKVNLNKLPLDAGHSELSTEFSVDEDENIETPKFSELSIILEKGESKYEPHNQVLPTEE